MRVGEARFIVSSGVASSTLLVGNIRINDSRDRKYQADNVQMKNRDNIQQRVGLRPGRPRMNVGVHHGIDEHMAVSSDESGYAGGSPGDFLRNDTPIRF